MNETDTRQAYHYRIAKNAIALFTMQHPEAKPNDWRVRFTVDERGQVTADIEPIARYYYESLN